MSSMKKLMRDLVDAVDGAGHEFKRGFAGAFRKRGGRHRADANAIRGIDRSNSRHTPSHRASPPTSHAKKYDMLTDVTRGLHNLGNTPRHNAPDYDAARDLGQSVGQAIRETPGDILDEIKDVPKKAPKQLVEELYEDAIGQDDPDAYGKKPEGDMSFLVPASDASDLSGFSHAEIEARFGLDAGSLNGANVEVKAIPGSRFVSVEIDYPDS
ncbi:hypothetical protein DC31_16885 [Microbacterium sp. CH12i]|uniref:hypothetical protein n=1 Tax=Microbacterium sp. CH12i TaxID=1479651 RepID=UPI0004611549|nr:hypothetical protein [Microbacterium sp. CH12i]KDA05427.1 hypothetical protein DC31_16885 [Microbacterium sp. CH12i]